MAVNLSLLFCSVAVVVAVLCLRQQENWLFQDHGNHSILQAGFRWAGLESSWGSCDQYHSCASCALARYRDASFLRHMDCLWCPASSQCYSEGKNPKGFCSKRDPTNNSSHPIKYQYDCPLGPTPYPPNPPTLLPDWMGAFLTAGALQNVTLVDLSLPGSHDTLSYDLSLEVSVDGMDAIQRIASWLHTLSGGRLKLLPGQLEEFFRMQGKTQQLTLTQQLDNGIRFLDVRIMYEPDKREWYSMHFMQSKQPARVYLQRLRVWMEAHPHEVVVVWLSKHGNPSATGERQYPAVTKEQKKQFWDMYCQMFDGLMQNRFHSSIFKTPVQEMIQKHNHRLVTFVSDYMEFSSQSPLAMDANQIQNSYDGGDGVFEAEITMQRHLDYFKAAPANNADLKSKESFSLLAMNTASPEWQVIEAAEKLFLHFAADNSNADAIGKWNQWRKLSHDGNGRNVTAHEQGVADHHLFHSCASHIQIPGVDHWCPDNLLDIAQLASYYNQIAIDISYQKIIHSLGGTTSGNPSAAFPHAFYLDGLDYDGTIRIGPQLLDGEERNPLDVAKLPTDTATYAFVDTVLSYNAYAGCSKGSTNNSSGCDRLKSQIATRRKKHPLQTWNQPRLGRLANWPPILFESLL